MKSLQPLFPFSHRATLQTAMPLGGIGAGCVCFNGHGGLQDFAIRNRPATSALPDGHLPADAAFALIRVNGRRPVTRLLEGPLPRGKIYDQGLQAQGYRHGGFEGLPRFQKASFSSGFPFARVTLEDPDIPLRAEVTGWSPMVPLDEVASGIPCAILEYSFRNPTKAAVSCEFSYHLSHLAAGGGGGERGARCRVISGRGISFSNTEPEGMESAGSASLTIVGRQPRIKASWLRGGWFDAVSALWREVESGRFKENDGSVDEGCMGRSGGSLLVRLRIQPGGCVTIPVVIAWHFPNSSLAVGEMPKECGEGCSCASEPGTRWRTYYSTLWPDAREVAGYVDANFKTLRARTIAFQRALLESSLAPALLDAVSANLAILKSPTLLRQANGNLWAWEGCCCTEGCCHGSCTHVWNYAQALPHLFPGIERTLREQEFLRSMSDAGHGNFRAALPDGPVSHQWQPAADGQLGGIMKLYRDWQISGDTDWMRSMYPHARKSVEFCIRQWDPGREGILAEPHHNTYDIDFWGPDGMCSTIYIGALCAISEMASACGNPDDGAGYRELAAKAARYIEKELFNGEYFEQKVVFRGLRDTSFLDLIEGRRTGGAGREMLQLLKREGPSYQYGRGCLSDGVIGGWMARIYGIETPLDRRKIRKNLKAIFRHNYRKNLSRHANCQRPGFALGDEPGLLLCSWPRGGKPTLPFVYSDEVWTGIEYQVASHLIHEGFVREGAQIVRSARSRYDGSVRNPWNEYECGSFYARAMASFALLGAYSGFHYSAVRAELEIAPKTTRRPFRAFFSTASGFGTIHVGRDALKIELAEGELRVGRLRCRVGSGIAEWLPDAVAVAGRPATFRFLDAAKKPGTDNL